MPVFTIQSPDGRKIKIEAVDEATAIRGAQEYAGQSKPKRSLMQDVTGAMSQFNAFLPGGDELAAAGNTAVDVVRGKTPLSGVVEGFKGSMAKQRGFEADIQQARPKTAALSRGMGMAAGALVPAGQTANAFSQGSRLANAGRGAVTAGLTAAGYAAADRGTVRERIGAASRASVDPLTLGLGAAGGAIAPAARKPQPVKARTDADVLREIGVSTSAPQRAGGLAKNAEDLAMRAPILGPSISGARGREVDQLNRGIALKALEPIGAKLPKEIKPGFEMVEYVDDALGSVYDDAARMVPRVTLDDDLVNDFARIGERRVDLAEGEAALFDRVVKDRLTRLQSGEASGAMVKQIHSELGGLQAEAARKGNSTLAGMLGDTRRAMMGLIERANPQAGAMIRQADQGWSVYSIMNDAAAQATNRGGVFLPGQLNQQVRSAGKRMGSNMAGKGKAPLQEIATAATRMIPDQFGNPGTANALGLGGMGVGLMTEPVSTVTVAAGLGAASTPYLMMGRKVLEELPPNAGAAQLRQADQQLAQLAAKDPAVAALRREISVRLSRAAGAAGGQNAFAPGARP